MPYKTYLFDFDGTLVDSMPSYIRAMLKILDERGVCYGDDIIKIITPLGYAGAARYYIENFGLSLSEEELISKMKKNAYSEYAYRIPEKRGVSESLAKLKDMGAELNILTASPHDVLDVCLHRLGIYGLFANVWSSDDFGKTKADPKIYAEAAERIGKPITEILFIDDNLNALKTAKKAGMPTCGIFDESSKDYVDEIKSTATHYVNNLSELLDL